MAGHAAGGTPSPMTAMPPLPSLPALPSMTLPSLPEAVQPAPVGTAASHQPGTTRRQCLLVAGAALTALGTGAPAWAEITSVNEAINKAGRQRMLSQRMAKAWLALGLDVAAPRARQILVDSIAHFERQLAELQAYAPTPEIKATYAGLAQAWQGYRGALVGPAPNRERAAQVLALDAQVLRWAHQGTVQLEQHSGRAVGKLVNMAGRERMLSQRTAKIYLSRTWGTATPEQLRDMDTARREFAQALQALTQAPQATEQIRQELALAQQQWVFFDNALGRIHGSERRAQHAIEVFASSENILQVMDRVTGLYSKLA